MQFRHDPAALAFQIKSFEQGQFVVNGQRYSSSIVLTNEDLLTDVLPKSLTDLDETHIQKLCNLNPEVILLGTGQKSLQLNLDLRHFALNLGFAIDTMDSQAACRTYTILAAEGRKVVAALLSD